MGTRVIVAACLSLALASVAPGGVMIQMGGIDVSYTGSNIEDMGTAQNPDPLTNATFFVNNATLGADTTGVTLDLNIPGLSNIPATGGTVSSAANGSLYLDLGGGEFISLTLKAALVSYFPMTSAIQFVFSGVSSTISGQHLPYGLSLIDPVSVSFSSQVTPGSVSQSGGYLTAFSSAGTGELQAVPEPATLSLLALGGLAARKRRHRR